MSATLTQYYDNFLLTIPAVVGSRPAQPIPSLSTFSLLALIGLLAALTMLRFKRR